jgi:LysM repeat protein
VGLLVVAAVLMSLVAVAAVLLGPAAGTAAASSAAATHMTATTLVVRPGDTLWSIATRVAPNADPRETITALRELNNLDQPAVYVGQRLIIPATR